MTQAQNKSNEQRKDSELRGSFHFFNLLLTDSSDEEQDEFALAHV